MTEGEKDRMPWLYSYYDIIVSHKLVGTKFGDNKTTLKKYKKTKAYKVSKTLCNISGCVLKNLAFPVVLYWGL